MRSRLEELLQCGYRYACALQPDEGEARALVHEAWLRLNKTHGSMPDVRLIFQTVRNLHIDIYRRNKRVHFSHLDDLGREAGEQEDAQAGFTLPDRQLSQALQTLRDAEREVLFLSVVEGYTAQEISELINSPRGTVLSTIHRARKKLKSALQETTKVLPFRPENDRRAQ
jgi:RNA polymerase sigma-70 factor (ECF subfamily)